MVKIEMSWPEETTIPLGVCKSSDACVCSMILLSNPNEASRKVQVFCSEPTRSTEE